MIPDQVRDMPCPKTAARFSGSCARRRSSALGNHEPLGLTPVRRPVRARGGVRAVSRRFLVLVLAAFALPAAAQTFDLPVSSSAFACISVADTRYRVARPDEWPDYTVRRDPTAAAADVRVHLTASIDAADLVLVGDDRVTAGCWIGAADATATKTIRIDANAPAPDLTIALVGDEASADYRIYLRGGALAPDTAAALFAAAQIGTRRAANKIGSTALMLR